MKIRAYLTTLALAVAMTSACSSDDAPTTKAMDNATLGDASVALTPVHTDGGTPQGPAVDGGSSEAPRGDAGDGTMPVSDAGRAAMDGGAMTKPDSGAADASRPSVDSGSVRD